jgi:hypothetical protein
MDGKNPFRSLPDRGAVTLSIQNTPFNKSFRVITQYKLTFGTLYTPRLCTIHTYIPEGVAEVSIFLRDTHVLPKLVRYEEHYKRDMW